MFILRYKEKIIYREMRRKNIFILAAILNFLEKQSEN